MPVELFLMDIYIGYKLAPAMNVNDVQIEQDDADDLA
jgi:hypothetical protein